MRRVFFIGLWLFIPLAASAALIPAYDASMQLGMSPQYPKPGDTVTFKIANYSGGADSDTYIWDLDGKTVLQGVGQRTLTLTAGALGTSEVLTVIAEQNGIPVGSVAQTISPGSVDLLWEGRTATPPFYIGRALPNGESAVTVLAVPHLFVNGKELPPENLVYTWKEDDVPIADSSGYGKSSVVLTPPRFNESFSVSVHVESADGSKAAEEITTVTPQTPTALVYENAPLLGPLFEKTVTGSYTVSTQEASFVAFPLFVNNPNALTYAWTLDGSPFQVDPTKARSVTFRKVGNGGGAHAVTFAYKNPKGFIESGQSSFNLTF